MKRSSSLLFIFPVLALTLETAYSDPSPVLEKGRSINLLTAIQETLQKNPSLQIQSEQVKSAKGLLKVSQGQFDWMTTASLGGGKGYTPLLSSQREETDTRTQHQTTTSSNIGVQKQLRTGQIIGLTAQATRLDDNLLNSSTPTRGSLQFSLSQPLGRGKSAQQVVAVERATTLFLQAAQFDLHQAITSQIAATASAYWQYLARRQILHIRKEAQKRAATVLQRIQQRQGNSHTLSQDELLCQASFGDRVSASVNAEYQMYSAKQALGVAMGITGKEMVLLADALDPFPQLQALPSPTDEQRYLTLGYENRPDLSAFVKRNDALATLVSKARDDLKPQIELTLSTGYAGLTEGEGLRNYYNSYSSNVSGLNVMGNLTYRFPVQNSNARGQLTQQEAAKKQTELQQYDTERRMYTDILLSLEGLRTNIVEITNSSKAIEAYQKVYEQQKKAFEEGKGSVLDLYQADDLLINERLALVAARLEYALAITKVREVTATFLSKSEWQNGPLTRYEVPLERLLTLP